MIRTHSIIKANKKPVTLEELKKELQQLSEKGFKEIISIESTQRGIKLLVSS